MLSAARLPVADDSQAVATPLRSPELTQEVRFIEKTVGFERIAQPRCVAP
jgi:hypothetical protein